MELCYLLVRNERMYKMGEIILYSILVIKYKEAGRSAKFKGLHQRMHWKAP